MQRKECLIFAGAYVRMTEIPQHLLTDKRYYPMKKFLLLAVLLLLSMVFVYPEIAAQCPMCRATAETNLANGGTEGRGLNNGIMYMLGMPYIVIGVIAFFWWKNRKQGMDETVEG